MTPCPATPRWGPAAIFRARVERWWPDLIDALDALYGTEIGAATAAELLAIAEQSYAVRPPALHARDLERTLHSDWLQDPSMIGYAAYTERMAGDLRGLIDQIPHLRELGVTTCTSCHCFVHARGDNDGGHAVADYDEIRPDLGTMDDLTALATSLHEAGINLTLDLVLNHVAREHEWAVRARGGDPAYRAYFHVFPDRRCRTPTSGPCRGLSGLCARQFTWDDELRGWVWTTFNEWQWDVAWSNPAVLVEYARIILRLANQGC